MANPTVKESIKKFLKNNGYDGLYSGLGDCACDLDDLVPCDDPDVNDCTAGYKIPCNCSHGCQFHISENKK